MRSSIFFYLFISTYLVFIGCKHSNQLDVSDIDELGKLHFPTTGNAEAQAHFETGVLLLHSFEYEDSRAAFLRAQAADPTHAMSYWGEAMTYNHSLWQRQEMENALDALHKLGSTKEERIAKVLTPFEQDVFNGIEILFGEGTKYDRDVAYSEYMKGLTEKYPDNHEISAFYAISLLGASRNGRNEELYGKTARIAQSIISENPNHPGALHYLIHSYDDPGHAHLAKDAADSYSKVAPDAAHALHMPSHIYVALGAWDDVVTSNIASWNASVKRMQKQNLTNDARSYHAYNWLQYGLLQRGEVEEAKAILDKMIQYTSEEPSKVARGYLVAMKGAQLVESNNWNSNYVDVEIEVDDLNITKKLGYAFIEGIRAYKDEDVNVLNGIILEMNREREENALLVGEKGFAMCNASGYNSKIPSQMDIDMVHVMEMELKAFHEVLKGDEIKAKEWFEKGVALDESLNYSYGPPTIIKPVHEAYAEWLLENGNLEEAMVIFESSLKKNPRRLHSLMGKKRTAELMSDEKILASLNIELKKSTDKKEWAEIL
jgi:tetratricopeptide (TPR) repeat protein